MARTTRKVASPAGNPAFDVGGLKGKRIGEPVRCGIVGLGRIGWSHHAQIQQQHPGFELVAVCDREPDRIAEAVAASGCAGYRSLAPFLRDPRVELVVVATPSKFHEPMALKALQAGKHVLVEKPAALKTAGIDRMIRAARRAGAVLTMHHNYRLNPEYLAVHEIIAAGTL
ncbi:MAG: Gfo/Idh/MocA family oxidoreductase, partial [Gemmatimonadota bacterium]